VQAQIQAAVDKAVYESELRQSVRTEKLVADFLNREREEMASAKDVIQYQDRRWETAEAAVFRQSSGVGGPQ
jgi:hypothetical protein